MAARFLRRARPVDPVPDVELHDPAQGRHARRSGAGRSQQARRLRETAGPGRESGAAEAAARADGTAAAADVAPAAEQDRNARADRGHLADRAGHRHHQRAVPARRGNRAGVLRREAHRTEDGRHLPPVRRLRQRRGLAAARGDHDDARHLAEAARERAGPAERQEAGRDRAQHHPRAQGPGANAAAAAATNTANATQAAGGSR